MGQTVTGVVAALACLALAAAEAAAGEQGPPPASCRSDMDCQLNGACTRVRPAPEPKVCVCDKGWQGVDCGTLHLNTTANVAYGYTAESKFSSWGGGPPTWDEATGKYQLLV